MSQTDTSNGAKPSTGLAAPNANQPPPSPTKDKPLTTIPENPSNNNVVKVEKSAVEKPSNKDVKITNEQTKSKNSSTNNTVKVESTAVEKSMNKDVKIINEQKNNEKEKEAPVKRNMISMKQIATKTKEKIQAENAQGKTEETPLSNKQKPDPVSRKESLKVLIVPNSDSPKTFRTNSRLSVSSTRRLSVESHRSLDFNPSPNNGTVPSAPLPTEVDDKYLLLQSAEDSYIRSAIPVLPIPMAVICLLINIVLPGFGTVLSGLSVFCCGRPRIRAKGDTRSVTCCVNVFVGLCQLCTITLCFVGWAWSLAWGILLIHFAVHFNRQKKQRRQVELQALALRAFTTNESGRTKLPF